MHGQADRDDPNQPPLAVVVLAVGAPTEVVDAVRSLLVQEPPVEIVVVNSGGGGMADLLAHDGINVPVAERVQRLFPGAARNIGIAATRAPYVAFLASDCVALPGWARHRLERHRAGAAAVGSALVNSHPRNLVAWAAHISTYSQRLPGAPQRMALAYGASYERSLFERYGGFREDLRTGEDTEFHRRLQPDNKPVWCPSVQTVHKNPTRLSALLRDQYTRGYRAARSQALLHNNFPSYGIRFWWNRVRKHIERSKKAVAPADMRFVRLSWCILPFAAAAFCLGATSWKRMQEGQASVTQEIST